MLCYIIIRPCGTKPVRVDSFTMGLSMMERSAYSVMTLPFVFLWIALFLKSPGIRLAMVLMSALGGLAGPISEYWHLRDYWHPDYFLPVAVGDWRFGIEDYILTFAMAGTAMSLFEKFAAKKEWGPLPPVSWRILFRLDMAGNFGILMMILFASIIGMNSIYAILLTILVCSAALYRTRPAWLLSILPAAAAFSLFYWMVLKFLLMPLFPGIIERWWNLDALWGVRLSVVPIEEPLWAFGVALFAGPAYRACSTGRMKNVR
jgi:hypothetical protein